MDRSAAGRKQQQLQQSSSSSSNGNTNLRATKLRQPRQSVGLTVVHKCFKEAGEAESVSEDYYVYEPRTAKRDSNEDNRVIITHPPHTKSTQKSRNVAVGRAFERQSNYAGRVMSAIDSTSNSEDDTSQPDETNTSTTTGDASFLHKWQSKHDDAPKDALRSRRSTQAPALAAASPPKGKEGLTVVHEYFRKMSIAGDPTNVGVKRETDDGIQNGNITINNHKSGAGLTQVCVKVPLVIDQDDDGSHKTSYNDEPADDTAISHTESFHTLLKMDSLLSQNIHDGFSHTVWPRWSKFTHYCHSMITSSIVILAVHAARNPKTYVVLITLLSFGLMGAGFATNFDVNTDEQEIYTPFKSISKKNAEWIKNESHFPGNVRIFTMVVHEDGDNVLGHAEYIRKVFDTIDAVRATEGYPDLCAKSDYVDFDGVTPACKIMGITRFFKHDRAAFEKLYSESGEEGVLKAISAKTYENGTPVDTDYVLGRAVRDDKGQLTEAEAFFNYILLPKVDPEINDVEKQLIKDIYAMRQDWENDETSTLSLEFFTFRSYSDEFMRAIQNDLFLLPVVFVLMSGFTCLVFFRTDRVQSRTLLGVGSVVTILLSLMSAFGIMFIIGIPFTSMTQMLPFVAFGVGLDDTFIITGSYFRTDPNKDPVDRIRETMNDIGLSISVTTITTVAAFILGSISSIPAIMWLNLYAIPTMAIDFIFQSTFFVALIVLDERRIQANKMDCCMCIVVHEDDVEEEEGEVIRAKRDPGKSFADIFMSWYTRQLLRPWVKVIVVIGFLIYGAGCTYTTSLQRQEFDISDMLPRNSYVKDFLAAMENYSSRILTIAIYFRDVDQMDPEIQRQMNAYIDDISALPQIGQDPPFCWFRDFEKFKDSDMGKDVGLENMTYKEQVDFALSIPAINETYGKHVVRDENGTIVSSRCYNYMTNIDLKSVKDQIEMLNAQKAVSARQPINQGLPKQAFFTFDNMYFLWEFYARSVIELIGTTVSGVIAVCLIGFFFLPHWGANLFVFPMVALVYIDLIGTLQVCGLNINAVTYVCLVISIGLLVDFISHVMLRYYESAMPTRQEKVIDMLETMGASILVGGLSTLLGVFPLAFASSEILKSVFVSFFSMVAIGLSHGLVFLPVLLSLVGPVTGGHMPPQDVMERHDQQQNGLKDKKKADSDSDTEDSNDSNSVTEDLHLEEQPNARDAVGVAGRSAARNPNTTEEVPARETTPYGIHCSFETAESSSYTSKDSVAPSEDTGFESVYTGRPQGQDKNFHGKRPLASSRGTAGYQPGISKKKMSSSAPSEEGFEGIMGDDDKTAHTKRSSPFIDVADMLRPSNTIRDESLEVVYRSYTLPSPQQASASPLPRPSPTPRTPGRRSTPRNKGSASARQRR